MESYHELIPRISKVLGPLKAYIRRHSHGESGGIISDKYFHSDHGDFEQEFGQGGLGEVATSTSTFVSTLFCSH